MNKGGDHLQEATEAAGGALIPDQDPDLQLVEGLPPVHDPDPALPINRGGADQAPHADQAVQEPPTDEADGEILFVTRKLDDVTRNLDERRFG